MRIGGIFFGRMFRFTVRPEDDVGYKLMEVERKDGGC